MSIYADTSFLASLYVLDANSALAASRMKRAPLPLLITSLGELELTNAVSLRLFRRELSASQAKVALSLIRSDFHGGVLMVHALTGSTFERAKQMARRHTSRLGTRTLDVLHVASALVLQADAFYSFDTRQSKLAATENLSVL